MIRYFDGMLTRQDLDELAGAFAAALIASGFRRGERVALYLQNVPQFLIAMIGTWKAGGIAVAVNPMNQAARARSHPARLRRHGLVALEDLYQDVAAHVVSPAPA